MKIINIKEEEIHKCVVIWNYSFIEDAKDYIIKEVTNKLKNCSWVNLIELEEGRLYPKSSNRVGVTFSLLELVSKMHRKEGLNMLEFDKKKLIDVICSFIYKFCIAELKKSDNWNVNIPIRINFLDVEKIAIDNTKLNEPHSITFCIDF